MLRARVAIYAQPSKVVVVHGACSTGADAIASAWVREQRRPWLVTEERHPAQDHPTRDFGPWPGAGPRRNAYMVGLGGETCLASIGPCTSPRCRRPQRHPSHGASGCADLAEAAAYRRQGGTPREASFERRWVLLLVEGTATVLSFLLTPLLNRLFPKGLCACPERKPGQVHVRGGGREYAREKEHDNDD